KLSQQVLQQFGGFAGLLQRTTKEVVALKPLLNPISEVASGFAVTASRTAYIMDQFVPFMATHNYRFSCRNVRAAYARLEPEEQTLFAWNPETIDWRHYMLEVHIPGLEKNVLPELDDRVNRPVKPLRRHDTLLDLIEDAAERHDRAAALMLTQPDGFARVSFRDLRQRARATAMRLRERGVMPQDRVLLSGANHPDWVVAWFGIQYAGAVAVPLDPGLGAEAVGNIARTAEPKMGIFDAKAATNFGSAVETVVDLETITAPAPADQIRLPPIPHHRGDVASILFTSGTTGQPKGVVLTHENFSALLASLGRLFPLKPEDRVLSVLPLHHTFEFTCGLLLPLSAGAQVIYLDELTGERLTYGLQNGQVTAMVGVPAVWQLLERRIHTQVRERGKWFEVAFDLGLEANRMLGQRTGLDAGRLLFAFVHQRLGGNIRLLISGGAALPKDTHQFFAGLGLHLAEGYGLTEASPVLTVAKGGPGEKYGNVGKAIPGVQIRILNPDANGVGEVLARGANVMQGYYANEESTRAVLDSEGWLHTGDLGRMDPKGRLIIVGRAKDVVVTASGENIYLDDLEARLGSISGVK
ncbi:MAG TPA: AMP-binding protein, partial [Myxococcota bacterium]|nr:AMP-binding protein [Myxococcota bacterium]